MYAAFILTLSYSLIVFMDIRYLAVVLKIQE